jgi:hypothetical protein
MVAMNPKQVMRDFLDGVIADLEVATADIEDAHARNILFDLRNRQLTKRAEIMNSFAYGGEGFVQSETANGHRRASTGEEHETETKTGTVSGPALSGGVIQSGSIEELQAMCGGEAKQ